MRNQGVHPNAVLHGSRQRQADTANLLLKESGYLISGKQSEALDEFAEGEEIFSAAEQLLGRSMALDSGRSRLEVLRDYDATCRA